MTAFIYYFGAVSFAAAAARAVFALINYLENGGKRK
jgi:hypothetical protein